MLSVSEAQALIMGQTRPLPGQVTNLAASLLGHVLAEDISSDLNMPPFDKSMMDGYAVRSADLASGHAVLTVVDEIMAGQTPHHEIMASQTARIMTGAPIPTGSDAVVMLERSRKLGDNQVQLEDRPKPGQNILPLGKEMRQGEMILKAGTRLRPQEFGLLATVGRTAVKIYPAPRVAILPTGDELVEPPHVPGPGQIRNSNGFMLLGQAARAGAIPHCLAIARDNIDHLRAQVEEGLKADVLILSGGVSVGQHDLVPGVLADLGVQAVFHKVEMKPGKPVFFGYRPRIPAVENAPPTLVFGLPGNPVSGLVCFELLVRPALARLQGISEPGPCMVQARLAEDFNYRTDRPTYYPAILRMEPHGLQVKPVPWFGSADLRGLLEANSFVVFPAGDGRYQAGQTFPVLKVE